ELEDERSLAVEGVGPTRALEYYQDPEPYFQTQYRILTGRELAQRVAGRLAKTRPDVTADAVCPRVACEPVRASHLVDVLFVAAAPDIAAETANALVEEYVAQNLDLRRQNMAHSLAWLTDELARQKRLVESSERAMAQYREDQEWPSLQHRPE